jgi:NTE family protein
MTAGRKGRGGRETAVVLGGGSNPGAHEIGMLWPLFEAGIRPDLAVGTSVGAVNAALVAAFPGAAAVHRLAAAWNGLARTGVFGGFLFDRIGTAMRSARTSTPACRCGRLLSPACRSAGSRTLRCRSSASPPALNTPRSTGSSGVPLIEAVLASCAVPGLVDSIPAGRAVALGARAIYVPRVGWIGRPLQIPGRPWEVAAVAFEVACRHRFTRDMAGLPDRVHRACPAHRKARP